MKHSDPSGFTPCFGPNGIVCIGLSLFGFFDSDDEPPPPDFCKDNTAGCGGVSAASTNQFVAGAPRLPSTRARPCLFTCKGGVFGVVFDFGGPGTGNPLILWAGDDDTPRIAEEVFEQRGGTFFTGPGLAFAGSLFGWGFGWDFAAQPAVSLGPEGRRWNYRHNRID